MENQFYQDYRKYENFIYSFLCTKNHTSNKKAYINFSIEKARRSLGLTFEDLVQEGRKYIIEALTKYGQSKTGKKASKSTFVFLYLRSRFINLGLKSFSEKYDRVDVDYYNEDYKEYHLTKLDDLTPEKYFMIAEDKKCKD